MRVETTRFGWIEIEEGELIQFPWGIPGFEELKRYVLLEQREGPFRWMQSVEDPDVAFVVCPPEALGIIYDVPEAKIKPVQLERKDDLFVLNIVSFERDKKVIRFHVSSPLLFNMVLRQAYQWTMDKGEVGKFVTVPPGVHCAEEEPGK